MQYTHAFFWALQVTIGIGRDIVPKTQYEVLLLSIDGIRMI